MPDQSFETEPHGLCIGRCATGFLRVPEGDLINVERLFHTSKITISIQRYHPYQIGLSSYGTEYGMANDARVTPEALAGKASRSSRPLAATGSDIELHDRTAALP